MAADDNERAERKADDTTEKAAASVRLVEDLVAQVSGFEEAHECHAFNENGVLPHVFFWDVVQDTVHSYLAEGDPDGPDWRRVLAFLEEETRRRVPGAIEVIVTSFLYSLPHQGKPGYGIEEHLGPAMKESYLQLRPWYTHNHGRWQQPRINETAQCSTSLGSHPPDQDISQSAW
ncbi:hypothetical protein [Streptomyces sp. NPDC056883]|uniref:hypothetical protein n=1 Tax=Streptomyces sp. NPDC056883 TaxID=3345959 RepID=UPI0036B23066